MQSSKLLLDRAISEMFAEIKAAPQVFHPSQFWEHINEINQQMLSESGLQNFKRTLAQNYFNWLVTNQKDPQFQALIRYWCRHPGIQPLLNRMNRPLDIETTVSKTNFIRKKELFTYKVFVGLLWEYALRHDRTGLAHLLEEPLEGNPILITRRGRRISQDLANSIIELNLIREHFNAELATASIMELGAGYGRLAHVFGQYSTKIRYTIIDIPPALLVSQSYISELFPDDQIFQFRRFQRFEDVKNEMEECRFIFLTPTQLPLLPDGYFNICLSISTFPEMRREQAEHFLNLMSQKSNAMLYLKQWIEWTNPLDEVCWSRDDYRLGPEWTAMYNETDRILPTFFNAFWERAKNDQ